MATGSDGAARVLSALSGSMSGDTPTRQQAESTLCAASLQPGFGPVLVAIAAAGGGGGVGGGGSGGGSVGGHPDDAVRQLAAVVLKKYIKEHWEPSSRHYVPPTAPDVDKSAVRSGLLSALSAGDPSSRVRTALGMAVAMAAGHDYPSEWPGLIEQLVAQIKGAGSAEQAHGALRCLSLIADDIDEEHLPTVVPELMPTLLAIASSPLADAALVRRCLSVVHGLVSVLGSTAGVFQRKYRDQLLPLLQPWLPLLGEQLTRGISLAEPAAWGVQMEVLKLLTQLVTYFSKQLSGAMPSMLSVCWRAFSGGLAAYEEGVVKGAAAEADADADGDDLSLESVFAQLFELLISLVGNQRLCALLKPASSEMVYVTLGYMQMTAEQAESWSSSTNQYVADDDDDAAYTCRVSAELLLDQSHEAFGRDALIATLDAVERRMGEAAAARAAGQPDWWRLREAALLALGASSDQLGQLARLSARSSQPGGAPSPRGAAGAAVPVRVHVLMGDMLSQDLQGSELNPFLAGRALWAAAKLSRAGFLSGSGSCSGGGGVHPLAHSFLASALAGVQPRVPGPVRIGALRVLACLVPQCARGPSASPSSPAPSPGSNPLTAVLPGLYEGLLSLLSDSTEESMHLVLETLTVVLKTDRDAVVATYLPQVALPVLQAWSAHVSDPVIGEDALEVLAALAAARGCLEPLAQHVLPTLAQVVGSPDAQPPMLVEGALDLMRTLLGPRRKDVASAVWGLCGAQLVLLMMTGSDAGMLQGAVELTCELLLVAGDDLHAWPALSPGGPPPLGSLMGAANRLLTPGLEESQCVFVGGLVLEMLQRHPQHMAAHLPQLLDAVMSKLVNSSMMALVNGLLLVLAKIALMDARQLVQALSTTSVTLPDGTQAVALDAVLPMWLERARDMHGRFRTSLCATALVAVLQTRHPRLALIKVKGRPLDVGGGVRTRSQAGAAAGAAGGRTHSEVPASVKLLLVLADHVADLQEAGASGRRSMLGLDSGLYDDEDEGEEEDGDDDEGEGNDEEEEEGGGGRAEGEPFGVLRFGA
ncbi:hypothetical protein FOA52_010527 [Chlamydomonas sp. UWO 241]|nr:hypothetical protein FOA52_010527 [Chlamydomonas sp. UWO 241]